MTLSLTLPQITPAVTSISSLYEAIPFTYMALFPILNPLGSAFIILSLTLGTPDDVYKQLCRRIAINTFILLFVVLIVGTYILHFFGITIPIVQVGGGFVVAMIGWHLLNQQTDTVASTPNTENISKNILMKAFYPFTMPITAGPGCMAVALTISAHETSSHQLHNTLLGYAGSVIGLILLSITIFYCYRYAEVITRKLGATGTSVIIRLSAFLNFCIGLEIIWHGLNTLLYSLLG